jgi:hypothetical protein
VVAVKCVENCEGVWLDAFAGILVLAAGLKGVTGSSLGELHSKRKKKSRVKKSAPNIPDATEREFLGHFMMSSRSIVGKIEQGSDKRSVEGGKMHFSSLCRFANRLGLSNLRLQAIMHQKR